MAQRRSDFKSACLLQICPSVIMADFEFNDEDDFLSNGDPQPYLFEPEYSEGDLRLLEEERARREAEERLRAGTAHAVSLRPVVH